MEAISPTSFAMNDAQVVDTSVSPRDYKAAGVVPFNDDGIWLARTSSGYADFGGKRGSSDETAWATARREMREKGGVTLDRCTLMLFHEESVSKAAIFLCQTQAAPVPKEARFITWKDFIERGGFPIEPLHPRLKYDKGRRIQNGIMNLARSKCAFFPGLPMAAARG